MKMKSCELCQAPARMFCDSDQASLCWDCDARVHSANFLVARHSRRLLCHACQSPTAWNASGANLGLTVSVCESCVGSSGAVMNEGRAEEEVDSDNQLDDDEEDENEEEEEEEEEEDVDEYHEGFEEEDEDGDNQVVPWSSTPPPLTTSSSSSEDSYRFSDGDRDDSLNRMRENVSYVSFDGDPGCSYGRNNVTPQSPPWLLDGMEEGSAAVDSWSFRPLKARRIEVEQFDKERSASTVSKPPGIVETIKRFQEQDIVPGNESSEAIAKFCRLSRNPGRY